MPKTILDRKIVPHAKLATLILGTIDTLGLKDRDAAGVIDCSESTYRRRKKNIGELTLDQLLALARWADIPIEEIRAAITFS